MSDKSAVAQEYKKASELSRQLNEAIIVLKRAHLRLAGHEAQPSEETEASKKLLAEILAALRLLLDSSAKPPPTIRAWIPATWLVGIQNSHAGDLPYYLEDLEAAARRLGEQGAVAERDLALLDELSAHADAETSSIFRRMMRT